MSRIWHHYPHSSGGIAVGSTPFVSHSREIVMINPTEKTSHCKVGQKTSNSYVLWFGAYGCTQLHVYARSLEDALDACIDWIADYAPGLLCDDEVNEEYERLVAEGMDSDEAMEQAEVDTTSGGNASHYLCSWEWGIALENPTTEELYQYVGQL